MSYAQFAYETNLWNGMTPFDPDRYREPVATLLILAVLTYPNLVDLTFTRAIDAPDTGLILQPQEELPDEKLAREEELGFNRHRERQRRPIGYRPNAED